MVMSKFVDSFYQELANAIIAFMEELPMKQDSKRVITCPYCGKPEILVFDKAPVRISVRCTKYHNRFYIADLQTGKTEESVAYKRLGRQQ